MRAQKPPGNGRASGVGGAPVSRVLEVGVVLEGGVTENHRGLGTAANREGVSNDCPLGRDRQPWTGMKGLPTKRVPEPRAEAVWAPPCQPLSVPALTWGSPARARTFPRSCRSPTRWNQSGRRETGRAGWWGCWAREGEEQVWAGCGQRLPITAGEGWGEAHPCPGGPSGCSRPSGRRGRSWGSPHLGPTRPPAHAACPQPP